MKKGLTRLVIFMVAFAFLLGTAGAVFAEGDQEVDETAAVIKGEALLGQGMTIYIQCGGPAGGPATIARTNGARAAAEHFGVKLIEQYSEWQPEKMIQQFKEALAGNPTGIAIMGHPGSDAFAPLVAEARSKGIIITSGNAPLTELYEEYSSAGFGYAGVDLYEGGYLTGTKMVEAGLKAGDTALVYGLAAEAERGQSTRGMKAALEAEGVKVDYLEISPEVNADFSQAVPVLSAYISNNPEVKAIGTQHGGVTAMFEKVLKEAGKEPGEVITGGIDLTPATIDGLMNGYVNVTLDQQLYLQGFLPVMQIVLSARYDLAGLYINTGAGVVTPETIEDLIPLIDAGIR
jgi:simple sugar transport system substrate-binding protein